MQHEKQTHLLNPKDKERIGYDIKFDLLKRILKNTLFLQVALFVLFYFILPDLFVTYLITVLVYLLSLAYIKNDLILLYLDLKRNTKIKFTTYSYEFTEEENHLFIMHSNELNLEFDVFHEIKLLDTTLPIIIEYTPLNKTLLFISNNTENLLETIEALELEQ